MRCAVVSALLALWVGHGADAAGSHRVLDWSELHDWGDDDHNAAFAVFRETCGDMRPPDWRTLCDIAPAASDARTFFEALFRPVAVEGAGDGLFTGYFEPELDGARRRGGRFQTPLYRLPDDDDPGRLASRAAIENDGALAGRGLEIAWVDDPVEAFFLQVQGSGRIRMRDGTVIRVGYAGNNGHEYRSVGQELVRRGVFEPHEVSAPVIGQWVRDNPETGRDVLQHSPSVVFFREVSHVPPGRGPLGAMNRSLTPLRSIAVDPAHVPLGAPVWIEKDGAAPLRRLMIAQDTGSAIKGAQRADVFFGTGAEAGRRAGAVRDPGRFVVLLPIQRAHAMAEGL